MTYTKNFLWYTSSGLKTTTSTETTLFLSKLGAKQQRPRGIFSLETNISFSAMAVQFSLLKVCSEINDLLLSLKCNYKHKNNTLRM